MPDRLEAPNEDAYGDGYGEDGRWLPRECVLCSAVTHLRCGVCRYAVCHNCPACPNGCEGPRPSSPDFQRAIGEP
jgi:hypothetical protein